MPSYLDSRTVYTDTEPIYDEKAKAIYDPRNLTIFQERKFSRSFYQMRPDLSKEDSYEWSKKFVEAELVLYYLSNNLLTQTLAFDVRTNYRYTDYITGAMEQVRLMKRTRLQLLESTRVGNLEEVQMKINWYDKFMDKIKSYELLYPIGEFTYKEQAQQESTSVKQRQDALKDKFLREMGVDYSILN